MKPTRFVAIAGLALGCPLFVWASTLSSSASCRIDGDRLVTTRNRTELAPLLLLMGLAQGAIAVGLMRKPSKVDEKPAIKGGESPALPIVSSEENPVITRAVALPSSQLEDLEDLEKSSKDDYAWAENLDGQSSELIYGPQGSGKTSLAAWLMHRRIALGHSIEVCDPHRKCGQWEGLPVYGDGMNYEEIEERIKYFLKRIRARYQQLATTPNCQFKPFTLVCDEFTLWSVECPSSARFFRSAMADIRKIEMYVIFISHDRTLGSIGGAKGTSGLRDRGLLEIQLLAENHPVTGEPVPKLEGSLKMPGHPQRPIKVAPYMKGSMDFSQPESRPNNVVPLKIQDRAVTTVDANLEVTDGSY